jgi:putative transposase
MGEHRIRITRTSGMNPWRAGCGESCTSGSEGGPGKPTSREAGRAPRSDPYTEHRTDEGKLYCCAIKDVYSNRIVGYSLADRMTAALAVSALPNAIALRRPVGTLIIHSDRGSQFRSKAFVRTLKHNGLTGSMGRVGACGDNAAMESFFSLLQKNVLDRQRWETREELRIAIVTWIERTYHRRRRQRVLGRLTPVEFEILETEIQAA